MGREAFEKYLVKRFELEGIMNGIRTIADSMKPQPGEIPGTGRTFEGYEVERIMDLCDRIERDLADILSHRIERGTS